MEYNEFKNAFEAEVGKEKSQIVFENKTINSLFKFILNRWFIISFRFLMLLFYFVSAYFEWGLEEFALGAIFAHFIRDAIPDNFCENNKTSHHLKVRVDGRFTFLAISVFGFL